MIKQILVILLTIGASFSATAQESAPVNEVSIVALIITSGPQTSVSTSVAHTLESLDAQTLMAVGPTASELRSILKRFAAAAIDTDIALVFFEGAVLKIDDREFIAPAGIALTRPSDLLTRAIPISALARATALAAHGGAVLVHATGPNTGLISGVTRAEMAPAPRTGTSPILFAASGAATALAEGLSRIAGFEGDIDLNEALGQLAALSGVTISQLPTRTALLRKITLPEVVATEPPTPSTPPAAASSIIPNLPHIGAASTDAVQVPEADTAVISPTTETDETGTVQDIAEPPEVQVPNEDLELSLDVLRAMQSALSRAQKRSIQRHLRDLHFYSGLIDGMFGRQSERAISAYQESIGAKVTGVLTPVQLEDLSE